LRGRPIRPHPSLPRPRGKDREGAASLREVTSAAASELVPPSLPASGPAPSPAGTGLRRRRRGRRYSLPSSSGAGILGESCGARPSGAAPSAAPPAAMSVPAWPPPSAGAGRGDVWRGGLRRRRDRRKGGLTDPSSPRGALAGAAASLVDAVSSAGASLPPAAANSAAAGGGGRRWRLRRRRRRSPSCGTGPERGPLSETLSGSVFGALAPGVSLFALSAGGALGRSSEECGIRPFSSISAMLA
jgi:hypothetical protein